MHSSQEYATNLLLMILLILIFGQFNDIHKICFQLIHIVNIEWGSLR